MAGFSGQIPVYRQIMQRIQADIGNGTLHSGDRLPSVRELSDQMTVNPNTMQRAMAELEREGVVVIRRGVGAFVTDDPGLPGRLRETQAAVLTRRYVHSMRRLGVADEEMLTLVRRQAAQTPPASEEEGGGDI